MLGFCSLDALPSYCLVKKGSELLIFHIGSKLYQWNEIYQYWTLSVNLISSVILLARRLAAKLSRCFRIHSDIFPGLLHWHPQWTYKPAQHAIAVTNYCDTAAADGCFFPAKFRRRGSMHLMTALMGWARREG